MSEYSSTVSSTSSWKYGVVNETKSTKKFGDVKTSRKYEIMRGISDQMMALFAHNGIDTVDEGLEVLQYLETQICKHRDKISKTIMDDQLASLELSDRTSLIRLLTHCGDKLNEDVLQMFPSLRARSKLLLGIMGRKEREDKIDLQFIVDFMHNYCRYDCIDI